MQRSLRVLRNIVTNYLRLVVAAVVGFVLAPLLVHHLGDRHYGLWTTAFSLTGHFGLLDQGLRPSLVRYVSRDHAAGDREGLSRTLSSALVLYTAVAVIVMGVALALAYGNSAWLRVDADLRPIAAPLVILIGASLAIGFPLGVSGAVLSGLQRYDLANLLGIAVNLVRPFAFAAVLNAGGGLIGLAWVALGLNLASYLVTCVLAWRLLPGVSLSWSNVRPETLRAIATYGGWALVGSLATNIAYQTDALVITACLGAALVTPFTFAASLVLNARDLVNGAAWVLSPTASEMDTLGERERLRTVLLAGARYSVLVSWPVLLGLIVFGRNMLETWVGGRYAWSAILITVLAIPTMIALPQATASSMLYGVSRHRGVVVLSMAAALVNLGLSIAWAKHPAMLAALFPGVPQPGLLGVAMGTAVPLLVLSGVATAWYACRALGQSLGAYLWHGLVQPGLVSLVFLVPAIIAQRLWRPIGWFPLLGTCAACWLVFMAVAWFWGIPSSDRLRWRRAVPALFGLGATAAGSPR